MDFQILLYYALCEPIETTPTIELRLLWIVLVIAWILLSIASKISPGLARIGLRLELGVQLGLVGILLELLLPGIGLVAHAGILLHP